MAMRMDETVSDFRRVTISVNYGQIVVKLREIMDEKHITRNKLAVLTDSKYSVVDRYYKGVDVAWADLGFLAKVCFVLNCQVSDLLEYRPPET